MNIFKNLPILIVCLIMQSCSPTTSKQTAIQTSPASTSSLTTIAVQSSQTSTQVHLLSPTLSDTPSTLPFSSEDLKTIESSNVSSLVKLIEIQTQNDYAISLQWSTDSKKIHILKSNGTIEIWDIQEGNLAKTLETVRDNSYSVGWYPTKNLVAYLDKATNEVSVWDLTNNQYLFSLGMHTFPFINAQSVTWTPD